MRRTARTEVPTAHLVDGGREFRREREEVEVVRDTTGWHLRRVSTCIIESDIRDYNDAVHIGQEWAAEDPVNRRFKPQRHPMRNPLRILWSRLFPKPDSFIMNGKAYVDGIDYYGEHDKHLILKYGEYGLNFCPSTPPNFR